jgi:hypothetical protein
MEIIVKHTMISQQITRITLNCFFIIERASCRIVWCEWTEYRRGRCLQGSDILWLLLNGNRGSETWSVRCVYEKNLPSSCLNVWTSVDEWLGRLVQDPGVKSSSVSMFVWNAAAWKQICHVSLVSTIVKARFIPPVYYWGTLGYRKLQRF